MSAKRDIIHKKKIKHGNLDIQEYTSEKKDKFSVNESKPHIRELDDKYPDQTDEGLLSDILENHKNRYLPLSNLPIYKIVDGIKIYDNTTPRSRELYEQRNNYFKSKLKGKEVLFTKLIPSTITAQGLMTNVYFNEGKIIKYLSDPEEYMISYGCNYGEKFNPIYKKIEEKKISGRGRKPKAKTQSKRKTQGNGKYFSSQISFNIDHPKSNIEYKIKLFRNGRFQVPGVRDPKMLDLVQPTIILRDYLKYNFAEDVQVKDFVAVMRNYKAKLVNPYYHVDLEKLEEIILFEKNPSRYQVFIDFMLSNFSDARKNNHKKLLRNYNPLNIAEMVYNTDRCFCLIIKFYRPSLFDKTKKTTVKLLKKGKINFDGGNSQQEVEELYYWLNYIYLKYKDQILFDIRKIKNEYDSDTPDDLDSDALSIYDDDDLSEDDINDESEEESTGKKTIDNECCESSSLILNILRKS